MFHFFYIKHLHVRTKELHKPVIYLFHMLGNEKTIKTYKNEKAKFIYLNHIQSKREGIKWQLGNLS